MDIASFGSDMTHVSALSMALEQLGTSQSQVVCNQVDMHSCLQQKLENGVQNM